MKYNLGYYYHTPAKETSKGILMQSNQKIFIESLLDHFNIVLIQHTPNNESEDYQLTDVIKNTSNMELLSVGRHSNVFIRIIMFFVKYRSKVYRKIRELDYLLLRGPSPLLPILLFSSPKKRIIVYLVAEYKLETKDISSLKSLIIYLYYRLYNLVESFIIKYRRIEVFTNSQIIYQNLLNKKICSTMIPSSTLKKDVFFKRNPKGLSKKETINILFSGRITPEKGIMDLCNAVIKLNTSKSDLLPVKSYCLHICGYIDDLLFFNSLVGRFEDVDLKENLIYHGFLKVDESYYQVFREADVFIMPSYKEGFPRVLWEAMASSLPIISTNVGSIPSILKDKINALLINPKSSIEIESAIITLLQDENMVDDFIKRNYQVALENTVESISIDWKQHIINL